MVTEQQLRDMLRAWIREYNEVGGLPREPTRNFLQSLIEHKGFVPSSGYRGIPLGTIGDKVEKAMQDMASTPAEPGEENLMFKASMVLRAYYLTPKHWPEEDRINGLKAIGLPMSRHTYYRMVQIGRAFLLGYLTPERNIEEAIA